jgi:hypothetical protein
VSLFPSGHMPTWAHMITFGNAHIMKERQDSPRYWRCSRRCDTTYHRYAAICVTAHLVCLYSVLFFSHMTGHGLSQPTAQATRSQQPTLPLQKHVQWSAYKKQEPVYKEYVMHAPPCSIADPY